MEIREAIAFVVAAVALITLMRTRRADLRLELHKARLEAVTKIGERLGTLIESSRCLSGQAAASEISDPDETLKATLQAQTDLMIAADTYVGVLPGEVLRALGDYLGAIIQATEDGADERLGDGPVAAQAEYIRVIRDMLGTDPLSKETRRLLQSRAPRRQRVPDRQEQTAPEQEIGASG